MTTGAWKRSASLTALSGGLAIVLATATGTQAWQEETNACRIHGRVTAGPTPLPGVALSAGAEAAQRATSTDVSGAYQLRLPPGEYTISVGLAGFQSIERQVSVTAASCEQTLDLTLTLAPRRSATGAAATAAASGAVGSIVGSTAAGAVGSGAGNTTGGNTAAGTRGGRAAGTAGGTLPGAARGRGAGAAGSTAGAAFQTLALSGELPAGIDAGGDAAAPLLLPPGFAAEAGADAFAITGNTAQVDRGLLNDRAEAIARGDFGNLPELAQALQAGAQLPPALLAELAARGGGPGPGGPGGPGGGGPGGRGGPGGDGFVIGGRGGRGNRIQATADYTFGGSLLDSAPYQLRGDAPRTERPYARQNFGTTFGGPVKIPGIYRNTSNRTTFQASYSANRGSNLFDQYATVPTEGMRSGDFSSVAGTLIDPTTGVAFGGNQIPTTRLSQSALALLPYIPLPNLPGTTRNYHYTTTTASTNDAVNARLQHTFGAAAGRGGRGGARGGGAGRGGAAGRGAQGRGNLQRPTVVALNVQLQYRRSEGDQTNVFSTLGGRNQSTSLSVPIGINVTHGRELHNVNIQTSSTSTSTSNRFAGVTDVAGRAGIAGVSTDPFTWGVPALSFSSISSLRDVTPSRRDDARLGLTYSWTHPLAKHSIRAGANLQMDRGTTRTEGNANGSFVFTGLYTSGGTAAVPSFDVADFLLGLPQQAAVQYGPGEVTLHGRSLNAFLQDDWRVRGNLTVNIGLRYELLWPFVEENGHLVNLDVAPDFSDAAPVLAGGSGAFTGDFPAALLATDANNIAPRIGIAWRTRGFVVRGGYGISYNSGAYAGFARQLSTQPPFAATNTQIGALNRLLLMDSALTTGSAAETANTFAVDRNYALGRVETWNADVQRALGRSWNVAANYTHTRGSNLDVVRAPNRGPDGLRIEGVQPFLWQTSEGSSVLNAANFTLQRRQVRGVGWTVGYALAQSRDNAPSIGGGTVVAQNDQDIDAEWGRSNFDRRHRLTASLNVELPFGANRPWLNNGGIWAGLFENWRLSTSLTVESGTPLSARLRNSARDVAQGQSGALRADYNGDPVTVDDQTIDQFFNTSAFSIPGTGLFGNSARNLIIGPGSRQLDGQISRDLRLGGTRALTIQIRGTNLLNLVNYTAIDTFVNSPTFGQVSSVRPMRSAQLNLRFRF